MSFILGFDAAIWQGTDIDFSQLKAAGYLFGFTRMTYAYPNQAMAIDPTANKNYYGMVTAGIKAGGYHKVGWTDPVAEADFFLAAMSPLADGDMLAYDMEPSSDVPVPANWSAWEQAFVQRVYDRTNVWPFRYENISMNNTMPKQGVVVNCPSWVAAPSYGWDETVPVSTPVVIQQGASISLPGITANVCDTDAFFGEGSPDDLLAELDKLSFHTVQASPTPPPSDSTPPPQPAPAAPQTPEPVPAPIPTPTPDPISTPGSPSSPTPVLPPPLPAPALTKPSLLSQILNALRAFLNFFSISWR